MRRRSRGASFVRGSLAKLCAIGALLASLAACVAPATLVATVPMPAIAAATVPAGATPAASESPALPSASVQPAATAASVAEATAAAAPQAEVVIEGMRFDPRELEVRAGTIVTWAGRDGVGHNAAARDGSWVSEALGIGDRWSRSFDIPGRHEYFCEFHRSMRGVIVVLP